MHKGSCLCRAITFEVTGELPGPTACHCSQCRKQTGHYEASADVKKSALTVYGEENVTWYQSSEKARRGFCAKCGSTLFWDPIFRDTIGVSMGNFDTPTDTKLTMHIFVGDKGDYYDINDGLPQYKEYPQNEAKKALFMPLPLS